ncbi:hypothetical protein GSI_00590 [Ganoderma sinense ZZ0214-1]|uniref:Uncharacterized protein n=1 Tax=Ganoderma sinense ZZ0214-1 TaxID=1077348 RepID=A0A2G8ST09_9APHY|nr:hypothetical protein GSI_00590 [Ganoderma sinense ZZ0214-1]
MSQQWVVDHVIKASILHPSGAVTKAHPTAIRRGDLVDVAATVEVVNMRGRGGWHSEVMVSPNHILRLKTAVQLRAEGETGSKAPPVSPSGQGVSALPELPVELGFDALHSDEEAE